MSSSFEFPELTEAPRGDAPSTEEDAVAAAREATEAARAEAYAAGRAAGLAEIESAARALASAAAELDSERALAAELSERAAAELALQLAEKVIGTVLELQPELVVEVVRGALRRLAEPRESVLLVNPDDVGAVGEAVEGLAIELGAPLSVRAERRVPRGGCLVRSQAGEIDARIEEQLSRARAVVEAELGR